MRILHLIATLSGASGGPAAACIAMAEAVQARGHRADIFTTDWQADAEDAPLRSGSVTISTFPVASPRFWKRSPQLATALRSCIQDYDLLHIHSLYLFHNMVGAKLARQAGKPYIVRPHGLLDPYIWRRHRLRKTLMEAAFQNAALSRAAAIHYTSADEMRISTPHACGGPGVVIPLGVDLPPAKASATKDPFRILFLSRLHPKKGLDLLIPAFAEAKARFAAASLVIAGPDDGALASSQRLVEKHRLQNCVSFPGMLRGAAKAGAFEEAGLFVLPSFSENFGIALAEAMAAGLPVITTDQVNIHDAVRECAAGIVTACKTSEIAVALSRLLGDPAMAKKMGENGRQLVAARYSWPAIGGELELLYRRLIEENGRKLGAKSRS